jgi:hypothetical protein
MQQQAHKRDAEEEHAAKRLPTRIFNRGRKHERGWDDHEQQRDGPEDADAEQGADDESRPEEE